MFISFISCPVLQASTGWQFVMVSVEVNHLFHAVNIVMYAAVTLPFSYSAEDGQMHVLFPADTTRSLQVRAELNRLFLELPHKLVKHWMGIIPSLMSKVELSTLSGVEVVVADIGPEGVDDAV